EGAALSPNEMMALPKGQGLATTLADQRYVFLGQRLNSIHLFDQLPSPNGLRLPQPIYRPRQYTDWSGGNEALVKSATAVAQSPEQITPDQPVEEAANNTVPV